MSATKRISTRITLDMHTRLSTESASTGQTISERIATILADSLGMAPPEKHEPHFCDPKNAKKARRKVKKPGRKPLNN